MSCYHKGSAKHGEKSLFHDCSVCSPLYAKRRRVLNCEYIGSGKMPPLESVEQIKVPDEIATTFSRATKLLFALSPAKELLRPQVYQR